jgi:hypothetical protein
MKMPLSFCELCDDELTVAPWYGVLLCPACTAFATAQLVAGECGCLPCLLLAQRVEEGRP